GGVGIPRAGRAAADAGMGHDAGRRTPVPAERPLGGHFPRPRHPDHRARLQPDGRRAERRPRPQAETLMALVEIRNLSVEFHTHRGVMQAVTDLDLTIEAGEVLGIVGESGSGKSVSMLALMGLIPWPGKVAA